MICDKCLHDKPLSEMVYNATLGYYSSQCKLCKSQYLKEYRSRNRDRLSDTAKAKYHRNPEPRKAYATRWAKANKKRHNETTRAWGLRNPEKQAQSVHNWDAKKRGASGSHTAEEWQALKQSLGNRCASCGGRGPLHRDHVRAPALGGTNNIDNIQPLCKPCNSRKGRKIIDYRPNGKNLTTGTVLPAIQHTNGENGS